MRLRLSVRVLAWLLLLASLPVGASEPLAVGTGRQPLAGHLEAFLDTSGALDIQGIHAHHGADFKSLPGDAAFGYQSGALWVRFRLVWPAPLSEERWLEIPINLLDRVDLYRVGSRGRWELQANGRYSPMSRRSLPLRKPTFRLPAQAAGTEVLYLRMASQGPLTVNPVLWAPPALAVSLGLEDYWGGLGAGLLILLAAVHLAIGLGLKDRTNLLYACYAGASLATLMAYNGYFAALLAPEHPQVDWWVLAIALPALIALAWPIFSAIVGLRVRLPRLDGAMTWGTLILGLALAVGRLAGFNHTAGPIQSVALPLLLVGQLITAFWLVWARNVQARFYLVAFLPLLVPFGYESAHNLGLPQINLFSNFAFEIVLYGHVVALNLPVVLRLVQIKRERDASVARELQASQQNERQLEALVVARTWELEAAKAQVEQALATAQEVLEGQRRLIQTVSHEFRTPLAIIDGTAQLLDLQTVASPKKTPSPATTIRAKVRRLLDFLDGALRQDQVESGTWRMVREPLDPGALLRTILLRVEEERHPHAISLRLDQPPQRIEADPGMLSMLLGNLLENALHYSPDGGEILVVAEATADEGLRVSVSDHGIGIPPEQIDRVFDRFYRTGQLPGVAGSGLGLYLSREIARMHGGDLSVASRLGEGSTFTLTLPRGA